MDRYSTATFTQKRGIPTLIGERHAIAHNKFMIIAGQRESRGESARDRGFGDWRKMQHELGSSIYARQALAAHGSDGAQAENRCRPDAPKIWKLPDQLAPGRSTHWLTHHSPAGPKGVCSIKYTTGA